MHYPLCSGSLILLGPGTTFCISPDKEESISYYAVRFIYKNLYQIEGMYNKINISTGFFSISNTARVVKLFGDMYICSMKGNMNADPDFKSSFYNLMVSFLDDSKNDIDNISILNRIDKTIDYINNNYSEKILIDDLSIRCKISNEYFIRVFKDYSGLSPVRYIINVRINKAKELLLTKKHKVKEVS